MFQSMQFSEYLKVKGASSSALKTILNQSPAHSRVYKEQTPAMKLGSDVHCAVLEPEIFDKTYIVSPKFDKRTKQGKIDFAEFVKSSKEKEVISQDDSDLINNIRDAVFKNEIARLLLTNGVAESSGFWKDQIEGVKCKMRADWLRNDRIIVDLKTCQNASPDAFGKQVINFGYDLQARFYSDGFEQITGDHPNAYCWIAVEKTEPFGCCVYRAEYDVLELGLEKYRKALAKYATCSRSGVWPGYPEAAKLIVPGWAFYK